MHLRENTIRLSATDLANHLSCAHLTELNRLVAEHKLDKPHRTDPILEVLIERGNAHEKAYVDELRAQGKSLVEIPEFGGEESIANTLDAIRDGVDIVVQAALGNDLWSGRPDLLVRVDVPSDLGPWSYEAADTKLTRNTKAGTVLQLSLYSDLLADVQGVSPKFMSVVMPGEPFTVERLRYNDFAAYYRLVKTRLENRIEAGPNDDTYPEPVAHCDICRWWKRCNEQRRSDDHLTFIAGVSKTQISELCSQGVEQLTAFAERETPLPSRPSRGSLETYDRVHRQAQIQVKGKRSGKPEYEFLDVEPKRGFLRLPKPDEGDIYFDIEGDPHAVGGVLEYLLGYVVATAEGYEYHCEWSLSRAEEKRSFEAFIDAVMRRWKQHPGMHIYHYAPYEPAAMKRLATRHATREFELDQLLRAEKFVDLYAIVRQGIRASVESYSIKRLEIFYGYNRLEELAEVRHSLHRLERALELGIEEGIREDDRRVVQVYNEDDCVSTLELHRWLESLRQELIDSGVEVPRPEPVDANSNEFAEARNEEIARLYSRLTQGIDDERTSPDEEARWLLAHLLEYFRREDKCNWWEFFRMHSLEHEELCRERTAVSGLRYEKTLPLVGKQSNPTHRYLFEHQDVTIEEGDGLVAVMGERVGYVAGIDFDECYLDIRKRADSLEVHPDAVFVFSWVNPDPMPESMVNFARQVATGHEQGSQVKSARYDLLSKSPPRLRSLSLPASNDQKETAIALAFDLEDSVLSIQGPPGAGKTFIGSHMIAALARAGKRVGVTAVSHRVILNMLDSVHEESASEGRVAVAHQTSERNLPAFVGRLKNRNESRAALDDGVVVGGTAWLWSHEDIEESLDFLFIDEAGQMSLAMALAAGRAARNIVLLGDPQQLEQPQQGVHPEGAEVAALTHVLDGAETMSEEKGIFLGSTWRLNPSICRYTSERYYGDRLRSESGLELQEVFGKSTFVGNGLRVVHVDHKGNQNRSEEEVEVIAEIVSTLSDGEHQWSDKAGTLQPITLQDVLVVAPYNAQVGALRRALPNGARVGTVDKFQGQEAPVVVYSMTSSSVADAPRGMSFLFSRNRMNVATSRARCLVILVGSASLFAAQCTTPEQIRLANDFCRYAEMALSNG